MKGSTKWRANQVSYFQNRVEIVNCNNTMTMIHVKVVFYVLSYNNGIFIVSRKKLLCKRVSFNIAQRFATGGTDTKHNKSLSALEMQPHGGDCNACLIHQNNDTSWCVCVCHNNIWTHLYYFVRSSESDRSISSRNKSRLRKIIIAWCFKADDNTFFLMVNLMYVAQRIEARVRSIRYHHDVVCKWKVEQRFITPSTSAW